MQVVALCQKPVLRQVMEACKMLGALVHVVSEPQEFENALRRDEMAVGIYHCENAFLGATMASALRCDGVGNLLFALFSDGGLRRFTSIASILMAGADQVQTLPLHRDELAAYLGALAHRQTHMDHRSFVGCGLHVDFDNQKVIVSDIDVYFTEREFAVLAHIMSPPGRLVARDDILERLYDGKKRPGPKIIDVFINRIRSKLGAPYAKWLKTEIGQGFRFEPGEPA